VRLVGFNIAWSSVLQRMVQTSRLERSEKNSKTSEGSWATDSCTNVYVPFQCGQNCGLPRRSRAKFFCFGFEPSPVFGSSAVQLLH